MPQSILEIAKDLTLTLVEAGRLSADDMQDTLQKTYATLAALKAQEAAGTPIPVSNPPPVHWRQSITRHAITCLECGQTFKQLPGRHLRQHNLDARTYRDKYGIPHSQPLAARATTAKRRQIVQTARPWEKAPAYIKAQERDGNTAPTPGAEAPTRQRKAARKKRSEG